MGQRRWAPNMQFLARLPGDNTSSRRLPPKRANAAAAFDDGLDDLPMALRFARAAGLRPGRTHPVVFPKLSAADGEQALIGGLARTLARQGRTVEAP